MLLSVTDNKWLQMNDEREEQMLLRWSVKNSFNSIEMTLGYFFNPIFLPNKWVSFMLVLVYMNVQHINGQGKSDTSQAGL